MAADLCETMALMQISLPPPQQSCHNQRATQPIRHSSMMIPKQEQQQAAPPLPPPSASVLPPSQKQYYDAFAATGYDKNRSLWLADLPPWINNNFFINLCRHVGKVVSATVIRNEQTQLPEYAFIECMSIDAAMIIFWVFNGMAIPNSRLKFKFKWAKFVCGLERPDGCCKYEETVFEPYRNFSQSDYRRLVSIEFVCVKDISAAKIPVAVYGTVIVAPARLRENALKVYDRSARRCQMVRPGDHLILTGPFYYAEAVSGFFIRVHLLGVNLLGDGDDQIAKGKMSSNQIAKGNIWWDADSFENSSADKFNQRLEEDIVGSFGSVTVSYTVFQYALNATLEVLLIKGEEGGESPTVDMYGGIFALQGMGDSHTCIPLLKISKAKYRRVHYNHAIQLTRPLVVLPTAGLSIDVHLWDPVTDSKIVDGAEFFEARCGIQTRRIGGGCVELEVTATVY